jgi:3-hydroxyisobutyrate dehydrogenase-like beta-hydroxyacid dehydrogenase
MERIADAATTALVVNVSTGTPIETVESAEHAAQLGLRYLTGAVMVPTPMVGTDECLTLDAGAPEDVGAAAPLFDAIATSLAVMLRLRSGSQLNGFQDARCRGDDPHEQNSSRADGCTRSRGRTRLRGRGS